MIDAIDTLKALGFEGDLGPAMTLPLRDGTTIVVASLDCEGEADFPEIGRPHTVQRLHDPMDHATIVDEVPCESFELALVAIRRWIDRD